MPTESACSGVAPLATPNSRQSRFTETMQPFASSSAMCLCSESSTERAWISRSSVVISARAAVAAAPPQCAGPLGRAVCVMDI